MAQADLSDPAVLDDLRRRMAAALEIGEHALTCAAEDLDRVRSWVDGEQTPRWKRELQRREEEFQVARRAWLDAESEVRQAQRGRGGGRQSADEERVAMEKVRRRRDQAEAQVEACRRWSLRLRQDGELLAHQCRGHRLGLADQGAAALARLGAMAAAVAEYQRQATGGSPPLGAP